MSKRLIAYYEKLARHAEWSSGDWDNPDIMRELFGDFTSVYDIRGKSLLDAGCGVGDFYQFLKETKQEPREVGFIDIAPSLIQQLKKNHPEVVERGWLTQAMDFFDFQPPKRYDVVTMFGLAPCVNHRYNDKMVGLKKLLEQGLSACNEALYVNFLSAQYEDIEPMEDDFYVTFHPSEVVQVLYNVHYTLYMNGFSFFGVLITKDTFIEESEIVARERILHYTR